MLSENKEDIFRTNIAKELTIIYELDESFIKKIELISLEDLIYLKLFLAYNKLNKKMLLYLPISEIVGKIVDSVMEKFRKHFD